MNMQQITLDNLLLVYNIIEGNLKPVNKLLNKQELYKILNDYTFAGKVTAVPYLFHTDVNYLIGDIIHYYYKENFVFTIQVDKCEIIDLIEVSQLLFSTVDITHPGVKTLLNSPNLILSGDIKNFNMPDLDIPFLDKPNLSDFTVFQSRNPPHFAHEFIIKQYSPKLLYTTPYSTVKPSDYLFNKKMKTYAKIQELYNIPIYVSTLPRIFAGPREALQNCILFQNLGAKYFVMGRGKNCVGNFYGDDESYSFCKSYVDKGLIKISLIWQETLFDSKQDEIKASNIKVNYIDKKLVPPEELMSLYISNILLERD